MSKTIDERVVAMEFDNKNFEQNVSTTMSTLDKFKQSLKLDGAAAGMEEAGKASDALSVKMSALSVAGMTAIANLTNSVMNFGKQLASDIFVQPVKSGFGMYEQKLSSIQTIMSGTGESLDTVKAALGDLNDYSNKTIYSFSDMTDSVGKFTNNGLKLDETTQAIKGICNWAALAGANTQQCSAAMYNLSQSLATGNLQLIDWKSVENANMGTKQFKETLIDTAIAMGTLTEAGEHCGTTAKGTTVDFMNFRDSLQEGWATTDVMMATFQKYSNTEEELGKKALAAASDIKTGTQLLDVLKEEVATGWSDTFELIIGDLNQAKELWGGIYNFIGGGLNAMSASRNAFIKEIFSSNWSKLSEQVAAAGVDVEEFKTKIIEVGKAHGAVTDEMIENNGGFERSLEKGWASADIVKEAIDGLSGTVKENGEVTDEVKAKWEKFSGLVDQTINGDFGNGIDRVNAFAKAGIDYEKVQGLVNKKIWEGSISIADLNEEQAKAIGLSEDQIKQLKEISAGIDGVNGDFSKLSGRQLLIETISNNFNSLRNILKAVGNAFNAVFNPQSSSKGIYSFLSALHSLSEQIKFTEEDSKKLQAIFEGLFRIIKPLVSIVGDGLGLAFKIAFKALTAFNNVVLDAGSYVYDLLGEFKLWFDRCEPIQNGLKSIADTAEQGKSKIKNFINSFSEIPIVTDALDKARNKLSDFKNNSGKYFDAAINKIKEFINYVEQIPIVAKVLDAVKARFGNFKDAIKEFYDYIKNFKGGFSLNSIETIFGKFVDTMSKHGFTLKNISEDFNKFFENLKGGFKNLLDIITGKAYKGSTDIADTLKTVTGAISDAGIALPPAVDDVSSAIDVFKSAIGTLYTVVTEKLSKVNLGQILAVAFGVSMLKGFRKLEKLTESFSKLLESVAAVPKQFASFIGGLKKDFEILSKAKASAMKKEATATLIKSLTTLVLGIAAAMYIISKIEDPWTGVKILGAIATGLVVFAAIIGKIKGTEALKSMGYVTALSVALLGISVALKMLTKLDTNNLGPAVAAIGVCLIALAGAIRIIASSKKDAVVGSKVLLSMSVSILILSKAITMIAKLDPNKAILALAGVEIMMFSLIATLKIISKLSGDASKAGVCLLAISATLLILVVVIKMVSKLKPKDVLSAILVVGYIGLLMSAIGIAMRLMGDSGKYVARAGIALLAISAAMLLMIGAIKLISMMSEEDIEKGMTVITKFAVMCGLLMAVSKLAGKYALRAGGMMVTFSAAMIALSVSIFILASIPEDGLNRAMDVILNIGTMFTIMIAVSKLAGNAVATIVSLSVAIGVMVAAVGILTLLDQDKMVTAVMCLDSIIAMLALLMIASESAGKIKYKDFGKIALLVGVIAVIGLIIKGLSMLKPENSLEIAGSLSLVLLALTASLAVLSVINTKDITKSIGALALMVLVFGELGLVIAALNAIGADISLSMDTAKSLSVLLLALSTALLPLSVAGKLGFKAELAGVAGLVILIAGMGGLMAAIAGLNKLVPDLNSFLQTSIPIIETIGYSIGDFFGSIVKGIKDKISGTGDTGKELTEFAENTKPFFDITSKLNNDAVAGVKTLAEAMLAITANDVLDSATKWLTGGKSMQKFAEGLNELAPELKEFSDIITADGGINSKAIEDSANAAKALAEFADNIPNSGGLAGFFAGENEMDVWANKLVPFANAIKAYSDAITADGGINVEAIESSANAGKTLTELASSVPNTGGLAGFFAGDNDIDTWAGKLVPFANAITAYSNVIVANGGVNEEAITASANAGKALVELSNTIPNTGGLITLFTGDNDIATFGIRLVEFGTALVSYSVAALGIDCDAIDNSVEAAKGLVKLENMLGSDGGFLSFFTGDQNIADFGNHLVTFGTGLSDYSASIQGVDIGTMSAVTAQVQSLIDLEKGMSDIDPSASINFSSNLTTLAMNGVTNFTDVFEDSNKDIASAVKTMIQYFKSAVSSESRGASSDLTSSAEYIITAFSNGIERESSNVERSAENIIELFVNRITMSANNAASTLSSIAEDMANCIISTLNDSVSTAEEIGGYFGDGFAKGISSRLDTVYKAAYTMGKKANQGAADSTETHSPSRVATRLGSFFGEGFEIGINSFSDKVKTASGNLGNTAVDSLSDSITKLSSLTDDSFGSAPTITPVLDLSEVNKGFSQIDGMFADIGTLNAVGNISANMASQKNATDVIQNGVTNATTPTGTTVNYTQNNYSPKALSNYEIYRQTKNQLAFVKKVVTN